MWLAIGTYLIILAVISGVYRSAGRMPPTSFQLLSWLASGQAFAYLLRKDRLCLGGLASLPDFGLLVLVAWPLVVPYHFFATRGRGGWIPFLLFAAIYFCSYAIKVGFYVLSASQA